MPRAAFLDESPLGKRLAAFELPDLPERDGDHWRLVDTDGATVARTRATEGVRVRLWHPVRHQPDEVRRWRAHLTDREIAQPFKQAYREIYLLTPAEEATRVYSNRFAAHILKYGQAKALLDGREWSVHQLGGWHGGEGGPAERVYTDRGAGPPGPSPSTSP